MLRKPKKIIYVLLLLSAALIPFALSVHVSAAVDYEDSWAKETIAVLMERGIIDPVDINGNINPQVPMTRAEVARTINRTYGYTAVVSIDYKDADPSAWYYKDLQIAKAAGYMIGDGAAGTVRPNDPISRQELSTVIGRILELSQGREYAQAFTDAKNIADWSIDYVGALAKEKVLIGYENGEFRPKNNITRAEAFTVVLRSEKLFRIKDARNSGKNLESIIASSNIGDGITTEEYMDVTVSKSGIALNGVIVNGDLIISADVGNGSVTLKNVTVRGGLYIRGGGTSAPNIITASNCIFNYIVLNSQNNDNNNNNTGTGFVINGSGNRDSVKDIIAISGGTIDIQNSVSPKISIAAGTPSTSVLTVKGTADTIDVKSNSSVIIQGKLSVLNVISSTGANSKITVGAGAVIDNAYFTVPSNVTGDGTITKAEVASEKVSLTANVQTILKKPDVAGTPVLEVVFQSLTLSSAAASANSTNSNNSNGYIQLTAIFDKGINEGLTEKDIGVKGASLVSVTGSGKTYIITVSNVTAKSGENVYVTVQKSGYSIKSATRGIAVGGNVINFNSLTANGSSSAITPSVTITFDKSVPGLGVNDFTVTGATKGTLTGTGPSYTLALTNITVADKQEITVAVSKSGYLFNPNSKKVVVYKPAVSFSSLEANGSDSANTSQLTITLNQAVPGLAAADFTVTGATKGALTQSTNYSYIYYLAISNITVSDKNNVTVKISRSGYMFSPESRTVSVRKLPEINFGNLTANGSSSVTTTELTIWLDKNVTGLSAGDISIDGATKGALRTGTSTGMYILSISDITVANGGKVKVTISKTGYNFNPNNREVIIYKPTISSISFSNLTADGSASTATSRLTATFSAEIPGGLDINNFTVESAMVSSVNHTAGTAVYTINLTGISFTDNTNISVTVTKSGITFNPNTRTVKVRNPTATVTLTYDANGGTGAPSSQTAAKGTNITINSKIPTRSGYTFLGWSTSRTGNKQYSSGDHIYMDSNKTLYAVWKAVSPTSTSLQY